MARRPLQEHISRIKELSALNENDQILSEPTVDIEMDKAMSMIMNDLPKQVELMAKTKGDRDGQIELSNTNEGIDKFLNEAGIIALGMSAFLSAPKLTELLGDVLQTSGKKFDNEGLNAWGVKLSKLGHKWHEKYCGLIKRMVTPFMKNSTDQQRSQMAEKILMSVILVAGVDAISAAGSAVGAGKFGYAVAKGGLGGIKAMEVFNAVKSNIANWVAGATNFA